ncbi:hypothetical protein [Streptomyces sp. NPDC046332]|uniref:hypothetical protein n=1 Tax=unclassified Streptomyces TaxID=2593676 RepID=UPI0033C1DDEF
MNGWAVAGITVAGLFVFLIVVGLIAGATESPDAKGTAKATPTTAPPTPKPSKTAPTKKAAAKPKPTAAGYTDGDYLVGDDIPPGTYTTPGAQAGLFELCSITTDPTDKGVMPQWKTGNKDERIIITITAEDHLVSISGCEPLTRR